jgi:hypothetical protein
LQFEAVFKRPLEIRKGRQARSPPERERAEGGVAGEHGGGGGVQAHGQRGGDCDQ